MIDTPQIVQTEARHTAVVRLTVPRAQIRDVMGAAIADVMSGVEAQGMRPAGPVFSHHLRMDPEVFDFEVGVPVDSPVKAAGRLQPGSLPATTVARTVYRGPYEGLGDAWGEFERWIAAAGHASAPDLWECYVVGPESGPDASRWATELNRPLAR